MWLHIPTTCFTSTIPSTYDPFDLTNPALILFAELCLLCILVKRIPRISSVTNISTLLSTLMCSWVYDLAIRSWYTPKVSSHSSVSSYRGKSGATLPASTFAQGIDLLSRPSSSMRVCKELAFLESWRILAALPGHLQNLYTMVVCTSWKGQLLS